MAASGTAVTVLTPNGRRQTVKVYGNTPLLQVLEDVCKNHGFNPDDHALKFQRTVLDLTLQWRFASLPNNAKLEMVASTRKQGGPESQVRIALQMEDGSRLQDSFSCGQSLWELLTHFPQISMSALSESESTPVCVYMRDEVSGEEALKNATLKSLGLTGGSAIVRFLVKKSKTEGEEDAAEAMEITTTPKTHTAKESMANPSSQPDVTPSKPVASTTEVPHRPIEKPPASVPATSTSTLAVKQEEAPKTQDVVRPKAPPTGTGSPEEDGEKAGPSGLSASSSPPSAPFIPFSGGGQRLGSPGAVVAGRSPSASALSGLAVESPKAKKAKSSHSNTKCRATAVQLEENRGLLDYLGPVEREPLIYHLDSVERRTKEHGELPDEFFEVTIDDVRKRFAQLKSERKVLEEAPLMTKALRESQMKEKMDRYPKVVLRIQFPDRHVLQGFFRPLETVASVRDFVKSHLEDPRLHFYLFTTPPKTILSDTSATLFQANLFPGALVYFGSDAQTDSYLKSELRESCVSSLQANETIASCMLRSPEPSFSPMDPEDPLPPAEPIAHASGPTQDEHDPSANGQATKPTRSDPGKVPKWLKLPGKK
ncbi:tether containing UBX domain for GLUT4 [Genypterus blacodes]|uniref:tether containing UBX domain for GLUT4 n=1 Tax=Genypterus blacodes TaxID=154954 RepID=UPI003F75F43D